MFKKPSVKKTKTNLSSLRIYLRAVPKFGKAQSVDMIIPTPNGDVRFGDLKVGDYVWDRHGNPTKVTDIFPQGKIECYEVKFSDGRTTYCNGEHIWSYITKDGVIKSKTLNQMMGDYVEDKIIDNHTAKIHKYRIPLCEPVNYQEKEYIIPPYALGILIGDGCLTCNGMQVSSNETEVLEKVSGLLELNYHKCTGDNFTYLFETNGNRSYNKELSRLNLKCKAIDKYIPNKYLMGSVEQRMDLLKGLMDSDGSVIKNTKSAKYNFSTVSPKLKDDFITLCNSLGIKVTCREDFREGRNICYNLTPLTNKIIVSTSKHLNRIKEFGGLHTKLNDSVQIVGIKKVEDEEMMCIMVDNDEHLYLCNDYIVTHNTTLFRDMVLEEYNGNPEKGLLVGVGNETGYAYLDELNTTHVESWADMEELKKWLIKGKKSGEHEIELVAFDTADEIIPLAETEVCRLSQISTGKPCDSINKAFGGLN